MEPGFTRIQQTKENKTNPDGQAEPQSPWSIPRCNLDEPFPVNKQVNEEQGDKPVGNIQMNVAPFMSIQTKQAHPTTTPASWRQTITDDETSSCHETQADVECEIENPANNIFHQCRMLRGYGEANRRNYALE